VVADLSLVLGKQMPNIHNIEYSDPAIFCPDEQDRLFRTVIQRSLSGLLIFQEDRVVFSNPALQGIVGLTEDEILRLNPFDLVHPMDYDLVRQRAALRLKGLSPPDDYEFRILHTGGKTRWVRLLATSIVYQGKAAILANILDIDERKRAEGLQREADRLRNSLVDSLPHPAMLIQRDHIILATNRHAHDLGARVGEFCGNAFGREAFGPDASGDFSREARSNKGAGNIKCEFCRVDQALESGEPLGIRALEAFNGLWDVFWIPVDADTYLHYAIDVTEQRKIEQEIRNSEERYRLITDTMNDGLSIQNRKGVITQVNHRLCEISGFARGELIGRPLADLFDKRKDKPVDIATVQGTRTKLDSETFIHHKDGRKIAVSLKIDSLIDDDDNHKGSFAFFSDISELRMLRHHALTSDEFENIVGRELSMRKLFAEIIELAACDFSVLIQGESGAGKELVAQAIHNQSHRNGALFVPVSCAALPEGLLESELFGHVKGAFTGAIRDKKGRFELAHGGTIFLDEIAELSPAMQVKLLRILQEGAFERVGDHHTTKVDVRIISATNQNLEQEMNAGRFRRDLFFRLCVMPILVPPLRERKNDIPLLADHFISTIVDQMSGRKPSLSPEALVRLMIYDWPGNVRELQNVIQFSFVKSKGDIIQPMHLPPAIGSPSSKAIRKRKRRRKLDQDAVRDALHRTGGNKLQAAKLLGVNRSTLYRFLAEG
jgi:sigma-54 dependent transcriptional regulator, acetoin dehydrogenase operon transcriptional activator AcoR